MLTYVYHKFVHGIMIYVASEQYEVNDIMLYIVTFIFLRVLLIVT